MSAKEIYNLLKDNEEVINIYQTIENQERIDFGAFHNLEHVLNVSNIVEKILTDLNVDEDIIYQSKIACLLHDVGAIEGKEGHAERSYLYAKELFQKKNWHFNGEVDVLDAILNHSAGFDSDNIIRLSIILADKLDVKKNRITEVGKTMIGNRQFSHIDDINIDIKANILTIDFITDGNLDIEELNEYYFVAKIFKAIDAFANKMNLDYKVLMDHEPWQYNIKKM